MHERTESVFRAEECETAGQREERTWAWVRKVIDTGSQHSRAFCERLEAAGLTPDAFSSLADLTHLPPLPKKRLIESQFDHLQEWLTAPLGGLSRLYLSPGPIFDPEGRGPDYWGWTEAFHAAGFRAGDLVQMTFSYHLTPAGLMLEEPLRELGCCVIPAGPGNTDVQVDLMRRLPVSGFVGMASFLNLIADKAEKLGLDPARDFSLKTAFVAAEVLTATLRGEVESRFGARVRQGYGTADVGCIAYECEALQGMHCSTRCHVEICEPGTGRPLPAGEIGEVVVTPDTPEYPLVRLATGDLSRIVVDPCVCGRTSPRLMGILGRTDATAKVKGQFLYPHQIREVMAAFPAVRAWQVRITNPQGRDTLTLAADAPADMDLSAIGAAFQTRLKLRPAVVAAKPGELEADAPVLVDERKWE